MKNKIEYPICLSKKCFEESDVSLLLIGIEDKRYYVLINDFNTFMYFYTIHGGRKHFPFIVYKCLVQKKILKSHVKDSFKINGNQMIKVPKKGESVKSKSYERKAKSLFMIHTDFESLLVPQENGTQNPNES